jgi:hypothetical protein
VDIGPDKERKVRDPLTNPVPQKRPQTVPSPPPPVREPEPVKEPERVGRMAARGSNGPSWDQHLAQLDYRIQNRAG